MRKYQPPRDHFFLLPNSVFALPLDAAQFKLYAYLVCRSGSKGCCWPAAAWHAPSLEINRRAYPQKPSGTSIRSFLRQ